MKKLAQKPKQNKIYGVLGVDSLIPLDENTQADVSNKGEHSSNTHPSGAYGLDHRLFTNKADFIDFKKNYEKTLKDKDYYINTQLKEIEYKNKVLENSNQPIA